MNLLLVEDEIGLREALATFLRLKGIRVRATDSCAGARAALAEETFDWVATDWRLGDGCAGDWLDTGTPALVMSGYPAEIPKVERWRVLEKPVAPTAVLAALGDLDADAGADAGTAVPAARSLELQHELAADVRDRVQLVLGLCGGSERARIVDDGNFVTLCVPLADGADTTLARIATLGGDQRVLVRDGRPTLELRLFADGRPEGAEVIAWDQPWPAVPSLALDFARGPRCTPRQFETILERAAARAGELHFLNVPGELRLWAEVLGRADDMPKRAPAGPSLPEVLAQLWR